MMVWNDIVEVLSDEVDCGLVDELLVEYREKGYLSRTCLEMLEMPDRVIAGFYNCLSKDSVPASPVRDCADSSWMLDRDFCFVNVRATGIGSSFGNWITAAKLLPVIRADAIHLGPFTRYDFQCIYAVQCTRSIAPETVHPGLADAGIGDEQQLSAFVQAAHLLGKVAGFDLEPHTTQFSIDVLMRPEMFRWIRLSDDRGSLKDGLSMDEMLHGGVQGELVAAVRGLVGDALEGVGLESLDPEADDSAAIRQKKTDLYHSLIGETIKAGLWTIPSHTWAGVGIPEFVRYNREGDYPEFRYLTAEGRDQGAEALSIVTPFKFFDNIPVNRMPDDGEHPEQVSASAEYFSGIALRWVNDFAFDFIRYDSADHIFDSVAASDWSRPASDRPTPELLRDCIVRSREVGGAHVGNFAERMGNELKDYAAIGFDLILGSDMFDRLDRAHLDRFFSIHDMLEDHNAANVKPASIVFCTDTHDTGNPFIHDQPLITLEGDTGMLARQFLSRFGCCGRARRPKYEVVGAQDLSHGLFRANVSDVNLEWVGDREFCRRYHWLEDVYDSHRSLLQGADLEQLFLDDRTAWWIFRNGGELLVCVLSLFQEGGSCDAVDLQIPLSDGFGVASCAEYNFMDCQERDIPLGAGGIPVESLSYREGRLYTLREARI